VVGCGSTVSLSRSKFMFRGNRSVNNIPHRSSSNRQRI
jgi:hypothetical protein